MKDIFVTVSAMCLNEEQTKLYSFAKQFNELFETDMTTGLTRSLGMLKSDKNIPMLVASSSGLYYYDNTLLVIPLNGDYFYFIDIADDKQISIPKSKYMDYIETAPILLGNHHNVYLMYPGSLIMLHVDMQKRTIEKIYDGKSFSAVRGYSGIDISDFALYSTDFQKVAYFELKKKELHFLNLNSELNGFYIVGSNNENVWYYHLNKNKIYKYSKNLEKLAEYDFEYNASPYPMLYEYNDKLYIIPLNGNKMYILDLNEKTVEIHFMENTSETEHRRFYFSKDGKLYFGAKEELNYEYVLNADCLVDRYCIFDVKTLSYTRFYICPENMEESVFLSKVNTAKNNFFASIYKESPCFLLTDYIKKLSDESIQNNDTGNESGSIIHDYIKKVFE